MAKKNSGKEKTNGKADESGIKTVARNRRRATTSSFWKRSRPGLVLTGTEVKSLRNGKASLEDAYAEARWCRSLAHGLRHSRISSGQSDEPRPQAAAKAPTCTAARLTSWEQGSARKA